MKGCYSATGKIAGLNRTQTVAVVQSGANRVTEILSIEITNATNAVNAQLEVLVAKITTPGALTGFVVATAAAQETGDQAPTSALAIGSLTSIEPTTYGPASDQQGVPSLVGYVWKPINPEERIYLAPSQYIGVKVAGASATNTFDCDITVTWKEIG